MNSSPDSMASMDEIVFVPLMIDESEPPSRLRSYRRKPKHPQKLSVDPQNEQNQQEQPQQKLPSHQPNSKRDYFGRKCSFSDDASSGEQSSGESRNDGGACFYFGEQPQTSFGDQKLRSFSSEEEPPRDESSGERFSSSGELSYNDLARDFPSSPSVKIEGSSSPISSPPISSPPISSPPAALSNRELFVPAPNGDGYYILTTSSPTPLNNDPVQRRLDEDDRGFSVFGNRDLDDDDEDDDDDEGILTAQRIIRSITSSSSRQRPTKFKILTMEMRPDPNANSRSQNMVETTVELTDDDIFGASTLSKMRRLDDDDDDEDMDWNCGQCDRTFDSEVRMRRHMKLVHGPKSFSCPECSKSFTQYGHMQVHLRTVHTTAKPFECNVCHRRFNVSSNRNRHQRLHFTKGSLHFVPEGASLVLPDQKRDDNDENKDA